MVFRKILQKMYVKNVLYVAKLFTFYLSNFLWTHLLVWVWQYNPKVMILKTMNMISKSSVLDVKKNCSDFAKKFIVMHKKRQTSFIFLINFLFQQDLNLEFQLCSKFNNSSIWYYGFKDSARNWARWVDPLNVDFS